MINNRQLRQRRKNGEFDRLPGTGLAVFVSLIVLITWCSVANASVVIDMAIISQIESSNNPDAYNKRSGARGLCQITPIVLKEFNKITGKRYSLDDLFIDQVNLLIADWYMSVRIPAMLKYYRIKDNVNNRLWAYNAGIGNVVKGRLPAETKGYLSKYANIERGI